MKKISALLMCCLVSFAVRAQVPGLINYQGELLDASGIALPDGSYTLTFHVYDAAAGGEAVWGPQIFDGAGAPGHGAKVPLRGGFFSVLLGDVDATNRTITAAFDGSDRYLQITVGGNSPMAPRQRIVSGPFALRAERVNRIDASTDIVDGQIVDDDIASLSASKLDSGTLSEARLPQDAIDGSEIEDESLTGADIQNGSLTGADIQDGTIAGADLQDGSVTGADIAAATISQDKLVAAVQRALCPPGTILPYAGTNAPAGWLLCTGGDAGVGYHPAAYSDLFAAIGYSFGGFTQNSVHYFRIPDLRGKFMRGVAAGVTWDPDRGSRVAQYAEGATGDNVGSMQTDALRSHTHTYTAVGNLHNADDGSGGYYEIATFDYGRQTAATGGNETRPVNVYINYIIKY